MMYVLSTIDYFMDMRPVSLLGTANGIMIQFDDVAVSRQLFGQQLVYGIAEGDYRWLSQ